MPQHKSAIQRKKPTRRSKRLGPPPARTQRNEIIERGVPGFAALRYRTKLNYSAQVAPTCGAGTAGTYVFSCNGLYDPDITSTGHQPMPFDQIMLSFEHYCVTRAKATVNFRSGSNTTTLGVAISLNASSTPVSDYTTLIENGVLVRDRLAQYPYDDSVKTLTMPIDIARFGSVPSLLSNPDYAGSIAANPTEQSYFHISVWNPDSLTGSLGISADVFIEYEAIFFEPRKNSASITAALRQMIIREQKSNSV